MKILVTGGTGNVGAEVVKALKKRNADIRLLVRKEGAPTPKGFEFVGACAARVNPLFCIVHLT